MSKNDVQDGYKQDMIKYKKQVEQYKKKCCRKDTHG